MYSQIVMTHVERLLVLSTKHLILTVIQLRWHLKTYVAGSIFSFKEYERKEKDIED